MKTSTSTLVGTAAVVAVLGALVATGPAQASPVPAHHTTVAAAHGTQPPKPGRQDHYRSTDSVPGLTRAVRAAQHRGLGLCDGHYSSLVTASGDLRGNGGKQYLVDTTCAGATASTPDEVALYDVHGRTISRSAVLSAAGSTPRTTAYPYVWNRHDVVLTYGGGKQYRLVHLTPRSAQRGALHTFR